MGGRLSKVCAFSLALLVAAPAAAADPQDVAAAEALFAEGRKLMRAKRFDEACPKLAESQRLDPQVGTSLNLALCYEKAGRTASAWVQFKESATLAAQAGQQARVDEAKRKVGLLEPKLSRLRIEVTAPPKGLVVTRDGKPVGDATFGVPIPVDPGDHTVAATAPGRKPWEKQLAVGGDADAVTVVVPKLAPLSQEAPADGRAQRLGGWSVMAAGGVGLVIGAVLAGVAQAESDAVDDLCASVSPEGQCVVLDADLESAQASQDAALAAQTGSGVSFALGGAAVIAGAALWWLAPKDAEVAAAPIVGPGTAGLQLGGRF